MKTKKLNLIVLLLAIATISYGQTPPLQDADTAAINKMLKEGRALFSKDPNKAIEISLQAKALADKIDFKEGSAYALKNIGLSYYAQAKYVETLQYWDESLKIFEELRDDLGIANLLSNLAAVYVNQGDDTRGLEYALRSLKLSEKTGDKLRILSALNAIGTIYFNKKDTA